MKEVSRRKALGQHFLKDEAVIHSLGQLVLELIQDQPCSRLLEIGPGKGALTHFFLDQLERLPASYLLVEKDQRLADDWQALVFPQVRTLSADFLMISPSQWLPETGQLGVVSNLPYSAGTAILNQLAHFHDRIPWMVLMFQTEVAKRLYAGPSSSARGSLSLWIQNHWEVERQLVVPPTAFSPPPKVFSEVVLLRQRLQPRVALTSTPAQERAWQCLLRKAFSQRRKMLRSLFRVPPWNEILKEAQVDETRRAESLDWDDWSRLQGVGWERIESF